MKARNVLGAVWLAAILACGGYVANQWVVVLPRLERCNVELERQTAEQRAAIRECEADALCTVIGGPPPLPEDCET